MKRYCEYILDKCITNDISRWLPDFFATKEELINSYYESSCFIRNEAISNRRLVEDVYSALIDEFAPMEDNFDADAKMVLIRCINTSSKLKETSELDTVGLDRVFKIVDDYLWLKASLQNDRKKGDAIHLINSDFDEKNAKIVVIKTIKGEIENARIDLQAMEQARDLPFVRRVFSGLEDENVRYYADAANFSTEELKNRMRDCRSFITRKEDLFYNVAATFVLCAFLRERIR